MIDFMVEIVIGSVEEVISLRISGDEVYDSGKVSVTYIEISFILSRKVYFLLILAGLRW